jgi:hypothetical protein
VRLEGKFRVAGLGMKQIGPGTVGCTLIEACLMDLDEARESKQAVCFDFANKITHVCERFEVVWMCWRTVSLD